MDRKWVFALGLALLLGGLSVIAQAHQLHLVIAAPWEAGGFVVVAVGVLCMLVAALGAPLLSFRPRNHPKLIVGQPDNSWLFGWSEIVDGKNRPRQAMTWRIPVSNTRDGGPIAKGVTALLEVYDDNGRIAHARGWWQGVPEPKLNGIDIGNLPPQEVDMEPNGQVHMLCAVMRNGPRPIDTPNCWLAEPIFRHINTRIPPGTYDLRLSLFAKGHRAKRFRYSLTNPDSTAPDSRMELRQV